MYMKTNEFSSWVNYPHRYKFWSIHFQMNTDIAVTERHTYDLLDLCSDIGGVLEFMRTFCSMLVSSFSLIRLKAIITNKLYIKSFEALEHSIKEDNDHKKEIIIPKSLDWNHLGYKCSRMFRCCNKDI
jgi:hypothetical protein